MNNDDKIIDNLNKIKQSIEIQRALGLNSIKRVKFRDTKSNFDKEKVRLKNKRARKARKKQRK